MDELNRLIGNDAEFPILRQWNFQNHAAVTPIPRVAGDALRKYASESGTSAYVGHTWYSQLEQLRKSAAKLINASADEIALVKNTSEGLAIVAGGIDWKQGDRIVTTAVEYPANIYPWMDLENRVGVDLIMIPEESADDGSRHVALEKILKAAEHERTRMISISHVEYASGQRHDLAQIGKFCRERGIIFTVDAIQSMGALPIDVRGMNIDYLSADGHKWLLGPEGAGVFFCRRELLEKTRPPMIGWMNVINAEDYGAYDFTLKPDARKFEYGTQNVPGFLALKASLELLAKVGIDAIAARLKYLTDHLIVGLSERGYEIISPRANDEWSGIVSFTPKTSDPASVVRSLRKDHRIEIALREGRLRASPHFYNTVDQIDALIAHLD